MTSSYSYKRCKSQEVPITEKYLYSISVEDKYLVSFTQDLLYIFHLNRTENDIIYFEL